MLLVEFVLFSVISGGEEADLSSIMLICDEQPVMSDRGEACVPGRENDVVLSFSAEEGDGKFIGVVDAYGYEGDEKEGEEIGGRFSC